MFSVKEFVVENSVVLTQCLDLLIYEFFTDVLSIETIVKLSDLPWLDKMDFDPPVY